MGDRRGVFKSAALAAVGILAPGLALAQTDALNADQAALQYSKQVPGFGGMFYDSDGVAHVYLTDMKQRATVMQQRATIMRNATEQVKFLPARFSFDQLHSVRDRMMDVMSDPNVVYLDIDEQTNRVTVGVSKDARFSRKSVDMARHFNVPNDAVVVKQVEPIYQLVSLRDRRRPAPAGMQINFPGFVCTLGFVVRQGGTNGFVTNSHCTSTQGGVESTPYWQPDQAGGFFGTEIRDPNYQFGTSGCPAGLRCRRTYSALVRFIGNNGGLCQFGRIARPVCSNCGRNLTIGNNGNSRFRITAEGPAPVGATVHKVGRTTGWTNGTHTNTCVTVNVTGTNITLPCQDFVSAGVDQGDSGSPVFQRLGGGDAVRLTGVLWGGSGSSFVYSPLSQVRAELGNFSVR